MYIVIYNTFFLIFLTFKKNTHDLLGDCNKLQRGSFNHPLYVRVMSNDRNGMNLSIYNSSYYYQWLGVKKAWVLNILWLLWYQQNVMARYKNII